MNAIRKDSIVGVETLFYALIIDESHSRRFLLRGLLGPW
jgi:hypothetical protein